MSGKKSRARHTKSAVTERKEEAKESFTDKERAALVRLTPVVRRFLINYTNDSKRRRIICEMVETERNYVNSLIICEEVYYKPLDQSIASSKPLIDSATMGALFVNIDQIREVHQSQILKQMDAVLPDIKKPFPSNEKYYTIANAFIEVAPKLQQLYTQYLSNENYEEILKKLKKNKKFDKFLNEALFDPRSKCQEIEDLLILPTQRIAGYKLLFERVIKYFPLRTHPRAHKLFSSALKNLLAVGKEMNSEKSDERANENLLNVAENLTKAPPFFCLMKPGRRLLGPFRAKEISPTTGKIDRNMIVFVLSDMLLITYKQTGSFSSSKLQYIDAIPLTQVHFSQFPIDKYMLNAITLKSDTHEYSLYVKKKEEIDEFRKGVKKQKKQIKAKVKLMCENGKEYMLNILTQLKQGYLEPKPPRTRKEALESLK